MLVAALEAMGVEVWEPFARNNQINRAGPGWAYRIGQADLHDVRDADEGVRQIGAILHAKAVSPTAGRVCD